LIVACGWLATASAVARWLQAAEGYDYYAAGHPEYRTCGNRQGGLALLGGPDCNGPEGYEPPPPEVDAAFAWLFKRSGYGHVVVLGASLADEYSRYVYHHLPPPHPTSVQTLIFRSRKAAADPFVVATIRNADALFLQGGDQADYVALWKDTPVVEAIQYAARRGAPLGGSSAGLAVLGAFLFSARHGTIFSPAALANPYDDRLTLDRDFLGLTGLGLSPYKSLRQAITDSHFQDRHRMGRMVAFLARVVQDGWTTDAKGIAIDEMTAVLVDTDGTATIADQRRPADRGAAYFLRLSVVPPVCQPGKPLTCGNVSVYRIRATDAGATFKLSTWTGTGGTSVTVSVDRGVLRNQ
jgi:cyanophycinase